MRGREEGKEGGRGRDVQGLSVIQNVWLQCPLNHGSNNLEFFCLDFLSLFFISLSLWEGPNGPNKAATEPNNNATTNGNTLGFNATASPILSSLP